jgi:two-component system chemotaxis response regulator CheY
MVVDDDRTMNSLLQTLLELDGFAVVRAPRGATVLSTAQAEKPDVIVMDVHLADADGLDLLRQVRQTPDLQSVPVVMCSGMALEEKCIAAGAAAFVLKPYPPDELSTLLKGLTV